MAAETRPGAAQTRRPASRAPARAPRDARRVLLFGGLVAVVSLLGLILDFAAPWAFEAAGDGVFDDRPSVFREDLVERGDDVGPYLNSITAWTLTAWLGGLAAGGLLAALALVGAAVPPLRRLRVPLLAVIAFLGALLLIAKTRLIGTFWAPLWYGETASLHPSIASYYHLAGGLLFLAGGLVLLLPSLRAWFGTAPFHPLRSEPPRVPLLTCAGVLLTLALLPIVPFAPPDSPAAPAVDTPLTERALAFRVDSGDETAQAAAGLASARAFLWAAFWISLAAAIARALRVQGLRPASLWQPLVHAQVLAVVPLLLAFGHGVVHFVALWRAGDTIPLFNWLPVLAPIALLALQLAYYRGAAAPATTADRPHEDAPPPAPGSPTRTPQPRKPRAPRQRDDDEIEEIVIHAEPAPPATPAARGSAP